MIPFRTRTVRVTTKGELDSALASNATRSIVVEGDDELLTYAARKASVEPDLSIGSVAFEAAAAPPGREPFDLVRGRASERTAVWDDPFAGDVGPEREGGGGDDPDRQPPACPSPPAPPLASAPPPLASPPQAPAPASTGSRADARPEAPGAAGEAAAATPPAPARPMRRRGLWVAGAAAVALGACGVALFWLSADVEKATPPGSAVPAPPTPTIERAEPPRGASSADPARLAPSAPATQPAGRPDSAPDAAPASPAPPAPPSAEAAAASDLPSLVWPVVAIVAIVALYLVARQAISSGSNVEIHWQVTEKVTGRLVITKQSRPAKKAAA